MGKPDSSDSTVTMEDHEDELPSVVVSGRASPAFITVENERGVLEHVQVHQKYRFRMFLTFFKEIF